MITAAAYGLEFQARALTPFYHPTNASIGFHRFLVGTSYFSGGNKIHLLEYQDETRLLECSTVWFHAEEIFGLWSSPSLSEASLLAVASPSHCRIFRLPDAVGGELLESVALPVRAAQVLWDLEGLQHEVRLVAGGAVRLYALGEAAGREAARFELAEGDGVRFAALDPHHSAVCVAACGEAGLFLIDTRRKAPMRLEGTSALHGLGHTRSVDLSCSKPNVLVTAGDDGCVRWHDVRMNGTECVAQSGRHLQAHEHSISRALLNPFHDELLLSSSVDNTLKLWDASRKEENTAEEAAVCLKKLTEFGDSVVNACWSSAGPWVFAGVSYNGKVLVDDVPKEKKMEILLKDSS